MDHFVSLDHIASQIFIFRGKKVLIDRDLALLYGVKTAALNQAVRRNMKRFPLDFMFQLTKTETSNWMSQFVISNSTKMGLRKQPLVFTEQGVAMLSSVLKSERAVQVNIQIMRTFTKMREMLLENDELRLKIKSLEKNYDEQFKVVFDALRRLLDEPANPSEQIGFKIT